MTENPPAAAGAPHEPSDAGLRVIIAYKGAKAIAWPLLALVLFVALRAGLDERIQAAILRFHSHLSRQWSIELAEWALRTATRRHLAMASGALFLDGIVSGVEAWALHRRKPWGEWLVVLATGSLLPFEIVRLIRKPKLGRFLVLAVNLAVVGYLSWRLRAEAKAKAAALPVPSPHD
jgi:uncharacterized membrane protein (DUF2068 family)